MQGSAFNVWSFALANAFNDLSVKVGSFLPNLIGALVVFLIGVLIANIAAKFTKHIVDVTKVDPLIKKLGISNLFSKTGFELNIAATSAWIVKWFVITVFLIAVANTLGLTQVSDFINQVALYLPNVIVAALILIIGLVVANWLSEAVYKVTTAAKLVSAGIISSVVKWAILIFALMAVLVQLRIAADLVRTLFIGIVAALALAVGISFGLGGKDTAQKLLEYLTKQLSRKK